MGGFATLLGASAQEKPYQAEAEQAGLTAKSDELGRRDALQDALAMQAVIAGASGRAAGEGSVATIREADIAKAGEDISMIKAGGKARREGLLLAGKRAKRGARISGYMQLAEKGAQLAQIG